MIFHEFLPLSDEEFCEKYEFTMEELEEKRSEKKVTEEKDVMWKYVNNI
jgi:hypothetical protein